MSRIIGIVGSRSLPASFSPLISSLVSALVSRGFRVASGGAVGADQFALSALVEKGLSASGVVYSAWSSASGFPVSVQPFVSRFIASGGQVVWGSGSSSQPRSAVVAALLGRNSRLVSACSLVIAFVHGQSRGTFYTIRQAVRKGIPVYVFLCGGGASLPADLASHCLILSGKEVF
jgi:predicted Rossmann fold nucleotide-binding protein DprA/Smf involved in DNA uptake